MDFNVTYHGIQIQRIANVWLHVTDQPRFISEIEAYAAEKDSVPSIQDQKGPAMVYIAAGVWYSKPEVGETKQVRLKVFQEAFHNVSDVVGHHANDMFVDPMDPFDGVGNQIFYAPPPAGPAYLGTDKKKIKKTDERAKEIGEMRDWLRRTEDTWNMPFVWAVPSMVFGEDDVWLDPLGTGFHVIDFVAETRANILLNLRCNAKLDRVAPGNSTGTCCTDYGGKPFVQLGLVYVSLVYLAVCIVVEVWDLVTSRDEPRWSMVNMQIGSFLMALLMCYYADRTQIMAKGPKFWSLQEFAILCVPWIVVALVTIRRSSQPASKGGHQLLHAAPDQEFMSRDQIDEWKGWMMCLILIHHWVDCQSPTIQVLARLLMASYLFQTGYRHTNFFLDERDFSFNRVATVLLRLNLLSCSLAYFMDTDLMFYYLSPLISFWFLIVYATMVIGHDRYNDHIQLALAKICLSCLLVSGIVLATPLISWLFSALHIVFNIQWSYQEWYDRVALDIFIVYAAMLFAVIGREVEASISLALRLALAADGLFGIAWYFHVTSNQTAEEYEIWHPYVSFIPILAFIAVRNVSTPTRNFHSKAMSWLGRCSLEAYTLQFHLLQAANNRGIILVDGFFGDETLLNDRWRTLVVLVPIFLWISNAAAAGTRHLVKVIVPAAEETKMEEVNEMQFSWAMERVSGVRAFISGPKIKIAAIIIGMWLLNLLSPSK